MLDALETPDRLRELFRTQMALNERIGVKTDEMNDEEKVKWTLRRTQIHSRQP